MKQFIDWLVTSSADPKKLSLFVEGWIYAIIPTALYALNLACGFHLVCFEATDTSLHSLGEMVGNVIFALFSTIAAFKVLYGGVRKVYLTIKQ